MNFKIRVPNVRVINANGDMLGVMTTRDAQRLADQQGLDLVEVSPYAEPPVCKIMDYGKFRYEESIKRKQARKNQKTTLIKEVKFHASVDANDLAHKLRQMKEFLEEGHKVKVTLQYRGRENAHKELGVEVVQKVIQECSAFAVVEQNPRLIGRMLGCMLAPKPVKPGQGHTPAAQTTPRPPQTPPAAPRPPQTPPAAPRPPQTPPVAPAAPVAPAPVAPAPAAPAPAAPAPAAPAPADGAPQ
ncbi:MAG: translation initiation factor IF-3 [Kiritimatiellia bacterium]